MYKIFKKIVLTLILIFLFISCSKEKNPIGYGDSLSNSIDFPGKIVFDFGSHAILKPDGALWTWGENWNGELGHGTNKSINIPTRIKSLGKIIDFDLSGGMCLAADVNGNVWFWGSNMFSCHIWPKILSPKKISYLTNINKVYTNGHLLRNDGSVWKIEIDSKANNSFYNPKVIAGMTDITYISGAFALKKDGRLLELMPSKDPAWGGFVAVQDVIAVQNSISHTVILKSDGSVWAWGQNSIGELGNGTLEHSVVPTQVKNLNNVIQISTNYHFNLALKKDGSVWFWGFTTIRDENNKSVGVNIPEKVYNLDHVIYIYAYSESMVIKNDFTYWSFDVGDRIPQKIDIF